MNHKRVYRLYKQWGGLMMRPKRPRRHVSACRPVGRVTASHVNESWSMDFMSDELYDGRRIRILTLVDNFTRESLAIAVDQSLSGRRVVEELMEPIKKADIPLNCLWTLVFGLAG